MLKEVYCIITFENLARCPEAGLQLSGTGNAGVLLGRKPLLQRSTPPPPCSRADFDKAKE